MGFPVRFGAGRTAQLGYLTESSRTTGAVVVLHDRYGHLPHLRARVDLLAHAGMTALALDLYDGRITADEAEADRYAAEVEPARAAARIVRAVEYLAERGAARVGLLGYGLGAGYALASPSAGVRAVVAYYPPARPYDQPRRPVQLHLADEQPAPGIAVEEEYGYPGARDSFANSDLAMHRVGSSELAWARTVRFLGQHLAWTPPDTEGPRGT